MNHSTITKGGIVVALSLFLAGCNWEDGYVGHKRCATDGFQSDAIYHGESQWQKIKDQSTDLKNDVKADIKNSVNTDLKTDHKTNLKTDLKTKASETGTDSYDILGPQADKIDQGINHLNTSGSDSADPEQISAKESPFIKKKQ